MNKYELVIVMDGKATSAKKKSETEKIEKLVKEVKGKVTEVKDWGTKELAYKIKKLDTGAYLIFQLELEGAGAEEIGSKLRLNDELIRYLLVRKEEKHGKKSK